MYCVLLFHLRSSVTLIPKSFVSLTKVKFSLNPDIVSSEGKSRFWSKLNFITWVLLSLIFKSFSDSKVFKLWSSCCRILRSGFNICFVLSLWFKGMVLFTGPGTRHLLRLKAANKLRSSTNLRLSEFNLGIAGLSRAPLKTMMKGNMVYSVIHLSKNIYLQKIFVSNKILYLNNFWNQKILKSKNFRLKKSLLQNNLGSRK